MRNLQMLRIDDRLDALGPKTAEAADQDSYRYIDLYPVMEIDEQVPGIRGWKSSLQFWQNISHDSPLDLIVSDVQFQRSGSPIQEGQDFLRAPLGLTHFKPLAAYVASRGRPFGFALHTGDHGYWFNTRNSEDDQQRLLARLAFHEIGEIAAILKQGETIVDSFKLESDEEVLKAANHWFESLFISSKNTLNTFADAQPLSLSNFRRSLSDTYVRPSSWVFLRKWLSRLENKKRDRKKCILDEDVCIEFILPDGRIDKIRLRSIFADFENGVYDFDLTSLSSDCFPIEYDEDYHLLTEDGFPKIGALLSACGSLSKAYHDACIQAEHIDLPRSLFDRTANKRLFAHDGGAPTSIGKLKSSELDGMAIGLTILFKYVEIQKWLQDNWNYACRTSSFYWSHTAFSPDCADENRGEKSTIFKICNNICQFLANTNGAEVQDIEKEIEIRKNRLRFFLELMVSSKIITKSGNRYRALRKDGVLNFLAPRNEAEYGDFFSLFNDINMPIFTPTGRVAGRSTILCNLFSAVSSETGKPQPTLLNRHLKDVHSSLVLNREFEDNIYRLPWLKTLLRDYCEDIGWTNEFEWPEYLK